MADGLRTLPRHDSTRQDFGQLSSLLASVYFCSLCLVLFLLRSGDSVHWFIVPVTMCGILIGIDAMDWLRGQRDIFDPIGIIGVLGIHFFFIAPLLHVHWDYWMRYITPPPDWREWLGSMGFLNFLGLLIYRWTRQLPASYLHIARTGTVWQLDSKRFTGLVLVALVLTGALQLWVYASFGGLLGYIAAFEANDGSFEGKGWIFMLSESFPILALLGYAAWVRRRDLRPSWPEILIVILAFFILKMLFGGLRGSRSNTIWGLFWAAGIIHYRVHPITRRVVIQGFLFIFLFMYIYGFYKSAGVDGVAAIGNRDSRLELESRSGRSVATTLLGDLGRSDVQAYLLYRLLGSGVDFRPAYGRTYLGSVSLLIPRSVWPARLPTKLKEGTEAQYGPGSYQPGVFQSTRVYGLAGEAMLNFGPFAAPLSFAVLGFVVGYVRRHMTSWGPGDSRWLIAPFLVNACFITLSSDSDNIVFFIVKGGLIPIAVILLGSARLPRAIPRPWTTPAPADQATPVMGRPLH